MRIGIYGAGAIGGYIGAMLEAAGHEVSLVARGEHLAAIRANGLKLEIAGRTLIGRPRAAERPADLGPQDYVFITVKAPALPAVARDIGPLLGARTALVYALNGVPWWFGRALGGRKLVSVDPDGALEAGLDFSRLIGCVVHSGSAAPAPGVIRCTTPGRFVLGDPARGAGARCAELAQLMNAAGLTAEIAPDIYQAIWQKFAGNTTANPLAALTGGTLSGMAGDPQLRRVYAAFMREVEAVGAHFGLQIGMSIEARINLGASLGAFKPSMLQDLEKGREMEIDALTGVVSEMAGLAGIATPILDAVHAMLVHKARTAGLYRAGV